MRNLTSLSTKLTALVALPLLALVIVAGLGIARASRDVASRGSTADDVELSLAAAEVARQLSLEGELSADVAARDPDAAPGKKNDPTEDLEQQRRQTDKTIAQLHSLVEEGSEAAQLHMGPALDSLDQLDETRGAVDHGQGAPPEVVERYADIADPVLDLDRLLDHSAAPQLVRRLDAHLALTRAIQAMARERSLVASVLRSDVVETGAYDSVIEVAASERHWLDRFESTASTHDLERYSAAQPGTATALVDRLRTTALADGPGSTPGGSLALWSNATTGRIDQLDALAEDTARDLSASADARQAAAERSRSRALLVFLAVLALVAGVLLVLHRWLLKPVRTLAKASRDAAEDAVPKAVELVETDGDQVARSVLTSLPRPPITELRTMADAVDRLQETAVELASDGASARSDISTVFLNFGQRTQSLVNRQLSHIDNLEARTEDPDTLADLFLLDHLATRLRRTAESLVVVAGADSPRPWGRPISAVNVVRAAVAEAADYSRVDLLPMGTAQLDGSCANDLSHLLAELIDNALASSPAPSRVVVTGDLQADGRYLVVVADAGKGMSARQLTEANERLARTPLVDAGRAGYFGLFVVGRLAKRHGVSVQLSPSRVGGVKAEVLLPRALLVTAATAGEPPVSKRPGRPVPPMPPVVPVRATAGAVGAAGAAPTRPLSR